VKDLFVFLFSFFEPKVVSIHKGVEIDIALVRGSVCGMDNVYEGKG